MAGRGSAYKVNFEKNFMYHIINSVCASQVLFFATRIEGIMLELVDCKEEDQIN